MSLTKEELQSIANLARIGLSEEEADRLRHELDGILGYVDRLQLIDTTGIPEASSIPVQADEFRVDEVNDCGDAARALIIDNFPASQSNMLKAPAVFEKPKS
ncbi:MAG: Asp-tRNA(Asn)/Glu-tRNA(Gln) amidotransferase subunit GatC [Patescibacteria group bacterium]